MRIWRVIGGITTAGLLISSIAVVGGAYEQNLTGVVVAGIQTERQPDHEAPDADRRKSGQKRHPDRDKPEPTTTHDKPGTTTSTQAPTTTVVPSTTAPTTTAPTTTLPPATTTSTLPLPQPTGEQWTAILGNTDTGAPWWSALYYRSLPYFGTTGWVDGDRVGYKCLYGFLQYEGQIVGRVTFTRVQEAEAYAFVNDKYMLEGARYYDGTLAPPSAGAELGDCPEPALSYEPWNGSSQTPTVTYNLASGQVLEVRNYKTLEHCDCITFQQTEKTASRVTVVAYEYGLPVIVVYYESMVPGVIMASDL
ncbi:MAG: hypothetical protein ABR609_15315 [Acidimicrobiia bacterium]